MESLPDETIFKIFEILEENRRSFWCNESRNLAQTCMRFEDLYLNRRKHQLLLGKFSCIKKGLWTTTCGNKHLQN